jgi:hypothetical protein
MKTKILFLTLLAIGMFTINSQAQTLDEIISKHSEAIGGIENWSKIRTMKTDMAMKMQGMEILISVTQLDCKAMRTDITVSGMAGYSIITDTCGWNYMPFNGQTKPEPLTKDMVKSAKDELCITDKLLRYKQTGDKAEYLGTDDIDGTECHKIKLTAADGTENTYFLDSETFLLLKKTTKATVNGQVFENSTTLGDYKKLDEGIVIAMTVQNQGGVTEVKNIFVNPVVDENIFKLPK